MLWWVASWRYNYLSWSNFIHRNVIRQYKEIPTYFPQICQMLTFYYVCLISLLSLSHTHAGTFKISKVIDNMCLYCYVTLFKGFLVAQTVKKILLQCRRLGLIPGLGKSLGEGNGYSLPYSCLENPWTKEAGGLQSMGSQRIRHNWMTKNTYLIRMLPIIPIVFFVSK